MSEIRCRELVGAYAVGALEPPEAAVLADHLLTCLRCRHVLAEAEETAALLAAVPPEMFLDEPADPNDPLLRRTLHAIRVEAATAPHVAPSTQAGSPAESRRPAAATPLRPVPDAGGPASTPAATGTEGGFPGWSGQTARSHRRRPQASTASQENRRYKMVGAAAAAVLVLGGGVMLGAKLSGDPESTSGQTQTASSVQSARPGEAPSTSADGSRLFSGSSAVTGVKAEITMTPISNGGVQLDGTFQGLQAGQKCKIAVVDNVGTQTVVENWTAPDPIPASGAKYSGVASTVDASKLVTVELLDEHGQVMVTAGL